MLIDCPECNHSISDKATSCPNCGYPMITDKPPSKKTHMRLPNGFGRISKIKGMRKPYRAMITVGKDENGRPIGKLLRPQGFFATYNEAYAALVEYHKDPYSLDKGITVEELYAKWIEEYEKKLTSSSSMRTIEAAWSKCSMLYKYQATDIRPRHIKACMEQADSPNIKSRIKSVFNLMYDYATEYELCKNNPARAFKIERDNSQTKEHINFTDSEMDALWENINDEVVSWILFQCYTGWRPQEMLNIKLEDIDWDELTIKGGLKTEAGIGRTVPICDRILPVAKKIKSMSELRGSEYLICSDKGYAVPYRTYHRLFKDVIERYDLNPEHKPHDPRKQFVTMCKAKGVNEFAIKRIVGHTITDITESVYTVRDPKWLREELNKLQ